MGPNDWVSNSHTAVRQSKNVYEYITSDIMCSTAPFGPQDKKHNVIMNIGRHMTSIIGGKAQGSSRSRLLERRKAVHGCGHETAAGFIEETAGMISPDPGTAGAGGVLQQRMDQRRIPNIGHAEIVGPVPGRNDRGDACVLPCTGDGYIIVAIKQRKTPQL